MKEKIKRLFAPVIDYYRDLRPSTVRQKRYRHILLLLYWAVYGLMFLGVERIFPIYSESLEEIAVLRRGRVRRARLYYLRNRRGKAARIKELKS